MAIYTKYFQRSKVASKLLAKDHGEIKEVSDFVTDYTAEIAEINAQPSYHAKMAAHGFKDAVVSVFKGAWHAVKSVFHAGSFTGNLVAHGVVGVHNSEENHGTKAVKAVASTVGDALTVVDQTTGALLDAAGFVTAVYNTPTVQNAISTISKAVTTTISATTDKIGGLVADALKAAPAKALDVEMTSYDPDLFGDSDATIFDADMPVLAAGLVFDEDDFSF